VSSNRKLFEFSHETKEQARELSEYKCDICGGKDKKTQRVQVHHQVAIWFARELGISAQLIQSLANAMCLCQECHSHMHHQENRHQYEYLAWWLLKVDVEADGSKDAWRKDPEHPINRLSKKKLRQGKRKRRK